MENDIKVASFHGGHIGQLVVQTSETEAENGPTSEIRGSNFVTKLNHFKINPCIGISFNFIQ